MKIKFIAFLIAATVFSFSVGSLHAEDSNRHSNTAVGNLVSLKHDGKTIYVSEFAVAAQVSRGDSLASSELKANSTKAKVGNLVVLKHDGKMIFVSEFAVSAQLRHGDEFVSND